MVCNLGLFVTSSTISGHAGAIISGGKGGAENKVTSFSFTFKALFKRTQQCWPNIMQQFSNSVLCCFFCKYFNASSFNRNKSYRIIKTFEKQAVEPSVSSLLNNVGPTLLGPFEQALMLTIIATMLSRAV